METNDVEFTVREWAGIPANEHQGVTGSGFWHDLDMGNLHVHLAEYTPGYQADDWCTLGHIMYIVKGRLITQLKDGREFVMNAGQGYTVSNAYSEKNPHKSHTDIGATLFIVDWPE